MPTTDFDMQVNLREETIRHLKAAKNFAKQKEDDPLLRSVDEGDYRAGNGTISNDLVIREALEEYAPDKCYDE